MTEQESHCLTDDVSTDKELDISVLNSVSQDAEPALCEQKIHRLSEQVSNQIAAGEVIERPASLVKELLENSLDANCTDIVLQIKRSANGYLSITDNGAGISKQDLPLAVSQHATSKLKSLQDLQTIASLGFRGEALASICSAARVKITSKAKDSSSAWVIELDGDPKEYTINPASHPVGTTVEVRDLFFNMPVRKRFLKAERTEFQHILEVFQKIALSNFACSFTLISDEKIIYKLPKALTQAAKSNRINKIFGKTFLDNASYFESNASKIKLYGWLGNKECHRSQTDQQYFFLNNRAIRDKLILHAIKSVFTDYIPVGRQPCYILYLELEQSEVDVNVHPTKHEVRFCEPRWVHQFINQQLTKVLSNDQSRDVFDDNSSYVMFDKLDTKGFIQEPYIPQPPSNFSQTALRNVPAHYNVAPSLSTFITTGEPALFRKELSPAFVASSLDHTLPRVTINNSYKNLGNIIATIDNNCVITCDKQDYYFIDLNAAYGFLVYQKLLDEWQTKEKLESTGCLGNLSISPALINEKLLDILPELEKYGFRLNFDYLEDNSCDAIINPHTGECFNHITLAGIPSACRYANGQALLKLLCQYLVEQGQFINAMVPVKESGTSSEKLRFTSEVISMNKLFKQMANLSLGRLTANLLPSEQSAIVDKLAKIDYNAYHEYTPRFAKKLTSENFTFLLNF